MIKLMIDGLAHCPFLHTRRKLLRASAGTLINREFEKFIGDLLLVFIEALQGISQAGRIGSSQGQLIIGLGQSRLNQAARNRLCGSITNFLGTPASNSP